MNCNKRDIDVIEGTTHLIRFSCSSDGEPFNFNEYKALLVIIDGDEIRRKETTIKDNVITARIDPTDTLGRSRNEFSYECRAFSSAGDVFHISLGDINVIKAKAPIIRYEED